MRRKLLFLATTFSDGNKLFAPVRSYTEVIECPQRNCINSADMFFLMSPTSWNLPLYQRFSGYSCKRNNRLLLESRFNTLFSTNTQNFPFITFPSGKKFYVYQKPVPQEKWSSSFWFLTIASDTHWASDIIAFSDSCCGVLFQDRIETPMTHL